MTQAELHAPGERGPSVSVIVPVLNEARYVEACLRAISAQNYQHLTEILVVDGMSTDGTPDIVRRSAAEDPRIQLLLSPQRRTPYSMNIGLAAATGDIVVRIDGHSVVDPDHVRDCVGFLIRSGVEHVGGLMRVRGEGYLASSIAMALSSPFGVGSARFRYTQKEQDLDTVPFGAYWRETLLRLGGFDERFFIGQDSELDYRIIRSGGRVRISPQISTDYYCRDSITRLSRQFFRYGRAKAFILHKHGGLPSPRALAPAALLSTVALLAIGAPWVRAARRALAVLLAVYTAGCVLGGVIVAARRGWRHLPILPALFMVLHFSHGAGFLVGLPRFLTPRPVDRMRGSLPVSETHAAPVPQHVADAS